MSGGQLAVLDRAGRDVKQYELPAGLATLGSSASCDIRFMLPTVEPHHATVVVHDKQTVVHNVGGGETLVNGAAVSVAPLAHGDVLCVGGRELRWRYARPTHNPTRQPSLTPVVARMSGVRARVAARRSLAAPAPAPRSPHRHSTPASARQVAVVQPQRRDASDNIVVSVVTNVRRRATSRSDQDTTSSNKSEVAKGRSKAPRTPQLSAQNATKASMWIESRKSSPRKQAPRRPRSARGTPLRLAVLRRAHSAPRLTKIQAPRTVDHMKQAAIRLMTGHTPKKKTSPKAGAGLSARRPKHAAGGTSQQVAAGDVRDATPQQDVSGSDTSTYSAPDTALRSPPLPNPKKSALKNTSLNRSTRKIESIKFDLSNLGDEASESLDTSPSGECRGGGALRYSDSSPDSAAPASAPAPSPPHSRSARMLEHTLGTTFTRGSSRGASPAPPDRARNKATRGSFMVHKVLHTPGESAHTTGSPTDLSWDTTAPSARPTTTPSPRNSPGLGGKMESYSVIDLVSMDSSEPRSVYSSASDASTSKFLTPRWSARRSTRSPRLLAASTPAAPRARPHSAAPHSDHSARSPSCLIVSRRSHSAADSSHHVPHDATYNISGRRRARSPLHTDNIPEITLNSTTDTRHRNTSPDRAGPSLTPHKDAAELSQTNITGGTYFVSDKSRRTKSFSTLKGSSENVTSNVSCASRISRTGGDDSSPDTVASLSQRLTRSSRPAPGSPPNGMSTPKNNNSPEEVVTPVLKIQNLLNSSRNVSRSRHSRGVAADRPHRKTIGGRLSALRKRPGLDSKSFTFGSTAASRLRNAKSTASSPSTYSDPPPEDGDITPKKTVKLVYEAVKNKHSTAKRPKSIRSVIDDLNDSDIVKELFNSPVKRKLSQSMIEFSKKQLGNDEITPPRKTTRNTIALTGVTTEDSSLERTPHITPDVFVSPLADSGRDRRDLSSKLRRWRQGAPEARGAPYTAAGNRSTLRKFVNNDSTDISGIKSLFARSPRNRLSDVRIKELFAVSPENDLRRVPRLRLLFQESAEGESRGVSGVRELYRRKSPADDLRNVSGVRATMRRHSPRNDLDDVSGVEELFVERPDTDGDTSFDLLMGRPAVRAYPRAKSFPTKLIQKPKTRKTQSLLNSFTLINDNVEDWLQNELRKRTHKESPRDIPGRRGTAGGRTPPNNLNKSDKCKSKSNLSRELLKLATDTVEGGSPMVARRGRSGALAKTSLLELKKSASEIYGAHMLPIKKRSLVEKSHKSSLPIKKRALHSTPVRRAAARLAAHHALSPIAPLATLPPLTLNTTAPIESPKEKAKRKTLQTRNVNDSAAAGDQNYKNVSTPDKSSPKSKLKQENIASPVLRRITRNRKTNHNIEQNNVKKRRTSIVVTKKPPSLSPKPATQKPEARTSRRRQLNEAVQKTLTTVVATTKTRGKRAPAKNDVNQDKVNEKKGRIDTTKKIKVTEQPRESPPKTRTTRRRKTSVEKVQTPKKMTRSKVLKQTVLITKPSPNLKALPAQQSKTNVSDKSPVKNLRNTRKTKPNKLESPPEIANSRGRRGQAAARADKQTENKKTNVTDNKSNEDMLSDPTTRRGRKTIAQKKVKGETKATPVKKRATRNTVNLDENVNKKHGGKSTVQEMTEPSKKLCANKVNAKSTGRQSKRKTASEHATSEPRATNSKPATQSKRGRVNNEELASKRRLTKGKQAASLTTLPAGSRRGRPTNRDTETSAEETGGATATRRRPAAKQTLGDDAVTAKGNSKEAAKKKLLARNVKTNVTQKSQAAVSGARAPPRKRKADVDTADTTAGPTAPKTRRAAAAGTRSPRAPTVSQAAARARRR